MALPRGFRIYLPFGEVGIAFSQFRVGQNIKFRFLVPKAKMKLAKYPYGSASGIVGFKKFFISKQFKIENARFQS